MPLTDLKESLTEGRYRRHHEKKELFLGPGRKTITSKDEMEKNGHA